MKEEKFSQLPSSPARGTLSTKVRKTSGDEEGQGVEIQAPHPEPANNEAKNSVTESALDVATARA